MPNGHAIAEDVPDQRPPSRSRSRRLQAVTRILAHRRPAMCQSSNPSAEPQYPIFLWYGNPSSLAHCDTVLHARRHLLGLAQPREQTLLNAINRYGQDWYEHFLKPISAQQRAAITHAYIISHKPH